MSITMDLPLYFIECNYDEWLYEYYDGSTIVLLNVIMTNGCMSIMKDLPLYYTEC